MALTGDPLDPATLPPYANKWLTPSNWKGRPTTSKRHHPRDKRSDPQLAIRCHISAAFIAYHTLTYAEHVTWYNAPGLEAWGIGAAFLIEQMRMFALSLPYTRTYPGA